MCSEPMTAVRPCISTKKTSPQPPPPAVMDTYLDKQVPYAYTLPSTQAQPTVNGRIDGLRRLSREYILTVHKVKSYFHLLHDASRLISNLFWLYFNDYC